MSIYTTRSEDAERADGAPAGARVVASDGLDRNGRRLGRVDMFTTRLYNDLLLTNVQDDLVARLYEDSDADPVCLASTAALVPTPLSLIFRANAVARGKDSHVPPRRFRRIKIAYSH